MTLLVASIAIDDLTSLRRRADQAWTGGADAVEIRIDTFKDSPAELAAFLRANRDRTWIVTCRSRREGGHFSGDTTERVSRLVETVRGTEAFIDFEWADRRQLSDAQSELRSAAAHTDARRGGLIFSVHDFAGSSDDLDTLVAHVRKL